MSKPEECHCCGFETEFLSKFISETTIGGGGKVLNDVEFWFCDLCCSTVASASHRYPGHYPDHASMKTTCYVGNVILAALGKPDKPEGVKP